MIVHLPSQFSSMTLIYCHKDSHASCNYHGNIGWLHNSIYRRTTTRSTVFGSTVATQFDLPSQRISIYRHNAFRSTVATYFDLPSQKHFDLPSQIISIYRRRTFRSTVAKYFATVMTHLIRIPIKWVRPPKPWLSQLSEIRVKWVKTRFFWRYPN